MARRRLAAWDDFRLVVIRPVVEADSKPGAACLAAGLAASRLGGNAELWKAFGDAAMAVRAVVQTGDDAAAAAATEELVTLRKRLYGLLADGPA